ncbi:helix-turn-helix domain-containing protein [Mariniflexile jejuense]|uniref:Helix-turn-helix domain-containing protein n=1 Tax=Mariniflexile jejuense TaxID=1173582 RepID=A0ABW3JKX3_9FLAO
MNLKENFDKIELKEIKEFVEKQTAEDLFLEFKTANYPHGIEYDKKNFSKCLSGFSNSSGGILIWGISAKERKNKPDVANELKPIENLIEFENYLKRNEGNAIIPLTEGVEYRRIFEDNKSGYLLVLIPPSERAPHMGLFADKRYYKRSGDSFYICEHFDIMDMINRKITPKLAVKIINKKVTIEKFRNEEYEKFECVLCIENIGQVSAKHITLSLDVKSPFNISNYGLDGNRNRGMKMMRLTSNLPKYIGGSDLVVHPETYHEVDRIVLNETGFDSKKLGDLNIDYKIISEGMKLTTGKIEIKKENLLSKTNAQ